MIEQLPSWIIFIDQERRLIGTPPVEEAGNYYEIRIRAIDENI